MCKYCRWKEILENLERHHASLVVFLFLFFVSVLQNKSCIYETNNKKNTRSIFSQYGPHTSSITYITLM